jgi:hypothetical protein
MVPVNLIVKEGGIDALKVGRVSDIKIGNVYYRIHIHIFALIVTEIACKVTAIYNIPVCYVNYQILVYVTCPHTPLAAYEDFLWRITRNRRSL